MKLCDINPFLRYAELQPSVMSSAPLSAAYDYRIFYILEGSGSFVLSDRTIHVASGMLIYFRPATPYYFDGKIKVIVLNFDMTRNSADKKRPLKPSRTMETFDEKRIVEDDPPEELSQVIIVEKAFDAEGKLQECLMNYNYPTAVSEAVTSALLKEILCFIVQRIASDNTDLPDSIQKVTLFIKQNYDKDISNAQISSQLGYHSFYLNRVFKKSRGITIHRAVIDERMRVARKLLKETDLSVNAVATEVGYADRARFCTAFKKNVGVTPLEYRKSENQQ